MQVRLYRSLLLALVALALFAGGCDFIEPVGDRVSEATPPHCEALLLGGGSGGAAPRLWWWRADLDLTESAPSSSSEGSLSQLTALSGPRPALQQSYQSAAVWLFFFWPALAILAFMLLIKFILLFQKKNPENPEPKLAPFILGLFGVCLVTGYLGGTRYTIHNPTGSLLSVKIDDEPPFALRPNSALELRLAGYSHSLAIDSQGTPIERFTLKPNTNPLDFFARVFWARGSFVYSVCGKTDYKLIDHTYSR